MNKTIKLFSDKKDCCSCWACENICPRNAITMVEDSEGFFFPEIDSEKCIKCGLCLKTCPVKCRQAEEQNRPSDKKYIKIVNLNMTRNYGASIAAACLEDRIRELITPDITVKTVFFDNKSLYSDNEISEFKEKIIDNEGIVNYIKNYFKKDAVFSDQSDSERREINYGRFNSRFLNLTISMSNFDLENDRDNNVALICGSDVIWHTKRIISDKSYAFGLNFGKDNIVRIAYAPSIDCKNCFKLKSRFSYYRRNLSKIDFVSVREAESVPFVEKAVRKKVQQCCDPALLYDAEYYDKMISCADTEKDNEKYIYAYVLDNNDSAVEYVKKLSEKKNLKICFFSNTYTDFGENAQNCFSDGPCEFLYRLKNAEYVVTTSFHCVVFSLLFKKQFLAFQRNKYSIKTPDLLNLTGLSERLITDNSVYNIDRPIDFEKASEKIEALRKTSIDFLENALNAFR